MIMFLYMSPCFGHRTLARRSPKRAALIRRPPFFRDFPNESPLSKRLLGAFGRIGGGVEPLQSDCLRLHLQQYAFLFVERGAFLLPPFGHRTLCGTGRNLAVSPTARVGEVSSSFFFIRISLHKFH